MLVNTSKSGISHNSVELDKFEEHWIRKKYELYSAIHQFWQMYFRLEEIQHLQHFFHDNWSENKECLNWKDENALVGKKINLNKSIYTDFWCNNYLLSITWNISILLGFKEHCTFYVENISEGNWWVNTWSIACSYIEFQSTDDFKRKVKYSWGWFI